MALIVWFVPVGLSSHDYCPHHHSIMNLFRSQGPADFCSSKILDFLHMASFRLGYSETWSGHRWSKRKHKISFTTDDDYFSARQIPCSRTYSICTRSAGCYLRQLFFSVEERGVWGVKPAKNHRLRSLQQQGVCTKKFEKRARAGITENC
jgi:hypothetical protein